MATKLPPVPVRLPIIDQIGNIPQVWSDWFQKLYLRIGGSSAETNDALYSLIVQLQSQVVQSGTILPFAGTSAPSGYLFCDGSAVSRTTYATLFAAISDKHGSGDGSTTFNLPDYRGRFLRGADGAAGRDPNSSTRTAMASGGSTGNNVGSVQTDATKIPTTPFATDSQGSHSQHWTGTAASIQVGTGASVSVLTNPSGPNTLGSHTHTISGGDLETRPINAYVNFMVKT